MNQEKLLQFIGLPYKSKGRTRMGVDCWGLVYLFYRDVLGLDIPSYLEMYEASEHKSSVADAIINNLPNWKLADSLERGDMLVFRIMGLPIHTGVYIGNGDFLHSFKNTNSCIERLSSITWNRRLIGAYRWQKI